MSVVVERQGVEGGAAAAGAGHVRVGPPWDSPDPSTVLTAMAAGALAR
jgi:hypothetical protein